MMVIGVGNRWRGDDAAGLAVAARLRELAPCAVDVHELDGDLSALIDVWADVEDVVVVDAARSGAPPGTVLHFDVPRAELPGDSLCSSSHAFGLVEAVRLGQALSRLPQHLEIYAIGGLDFRLGEGLSPGVADAVNQVADTLRRRASTRRS
jgi:hydrogenase maturation protease